MFSTKKQQKKSLFLPRWNYFQTLWYGCWVTKRFVCLHSLSACHNRCEWKKWDFHFYSNVEETLQFGAVWKDSLLQFLLPEALITNRSIARSKQADGLCFPPLCTVSVCVQQCRAWLQRCISCTVPCCLTAHRAAPWWWAAVSHFALWAQTYGLRQIFWADHLKVFLNVFCSAALYICNILF